MNENKIIKVLSNSNNDVPIWFLRQAGRHIPEYFSIRSKAKDFIDFCLQEDLIVESTMLPLKYYKIDAAIVFSDILMIPWTMKRNLQFKENIGPVLTPMIPDETVIEDNVNIFDSLKPLEKAIRRIRKSLDTSVSLIGFAGAPWTLSCYMIEGRGSKDFVNTRKAVWGSLPWFTKLINTLVIYVTDKLEMQARAGADVLMIFDSWSHMIPDGFFKEFGIDPTAQIIHNLRQRNVLSPVIGFPFRAGSYLEQYSYESNVNCIALDWNVNLKWACKFINSNISIQGNLDPAALIPTKSPNLKDRVENIINVMKERQFIFNVGHGLTPQCKIDNIKYVIDIVRNIKSE